LGLPGFNRPGSPNLEEEGLLIHKIIAVFQKNGETMILTKGDASVCPDKPIPVKSVLGKVIFIEKPETCESNNSEAII
jgi:hypothetical protein